MPHLVCISLGSIPPPNPPPPTLLCDISAEFISQHLLMTFPNLADLLTLTPPPTSPTSLGLHQSCQVLAAVRITIQLILSCICIYIYQFYLCTYPHIGSVAPLGTPQTGGGNHHSARLSRPVVCKPHRQPPTRRLSCGQSHCFRISQGSHPFTPQLEPVSSRAGRPACLQMCC